MSVGDGDTALLRVEQGICRQNQNMDLTILFKNQARYVFWCPVPRFNN